MHQGGISSTRIALAQRTEYTELLLRAATYFERRKTQSTDRTHNHNITVLKVNPLLLRLLLYNFRRGNTLISPARNFCCRL